MTALRLLVLCVLLSANTAASVPCCRHLEPEDGTASPDGGICLPMSFEAHPEDSTDAGSTADKEEDKDKKKDETWYVSKIDGPTKNVHFETTEATWLNLDVSPDGKSVVFDVLGDLYTVSLSGGDAKRVTSGPAYEHQPRFSPDGSRILFTSDRGGSDNIWGARRDGTEMRPLTAEKRETNTADWSPDGEYLVARRRLTDTSSLGTVELWLYHVLGGEGVQVTKKDDIPDSNDPVFSPDGRWIYFSARNSRYQYNRNVYAGIWQVRAYDRETGRLRTITDSYGGAGRPSLSPDGKTVSFVRRDRDKTLLVLQDLLSGAERTLFDGLDMDMQENFANTGVYPGYDWTPDGKAIVISFGGGIHKIDVASGRVTDVPFRATVDQDVAETLRFPRDIAPEETRIRMISWPNATRDGKTLVFSALGRLYRLALPDGSPKVLKTEGARAYAPAISPDGKRIAYVSWSDKEQGHVWVTSISGGGGRRVTRVAGQYANPAFSQDGSKLAFVKGSGSTRHGRSLGDESALEILWVPVSGGEPAFVVSLGNRGSSRRMPRPVWSADGNRIFYNEDDGDGVDMKTHLVSIRPDGTDKRTHLKIKHAEEIIPSPDGRWALFARLFEGFLIPLPEVGNGPMEVSGKGDGVPTYNFTQSGADWLGWSADGSTLTWGFGPTFYRLPLEDVRALWLRDQVKAGEKTVPKTEEEDSKKEEDEEETAGAVDSTKAHPDTFAVALSVPRAKPKGVFALTGARIVTMRGDEVIPSGTVVVRDDRIEAVGASVQIPDGARVIDVSGKTVIPGLIDVHAHLHYDHLDIIPESIASYYANLAYGVTTTHDPSASTYAVFTQSEMVEAGVTVGPRIFSTGFILYGADIPNKAPIDNLEDARRHLKRLKTLGAFSVKSYMQPRREQRQWIIKAAREESMLVVPEGGGNLEVNLGMVIDGHTGIEHALPVTPLYDDVVRLFAETGVGYTPTLLVAYGGLSGEHWFYQHDEVWQNEKLLRFTPRGELDARARRRPIMATDDDWHHMDVAAGAKAIVEAGGRVQLGAHGQLQGLGAHWELWALTQGGMSEHDALRCATIFGAEYLGLDSQIGSVETGKLADLIVVDGDPLEDIHATNAIRYVVKNGEVFEGETMERVWPSEATCPRFYWQPAE